MKLSRPGITPSVKLPKVATLESEEQSLTPLQQLVITAVVMTVWALFSAGYYAFVTKFWPWVVPYGFWDLWQTHGTIADWLTAGIPMFIWAIVLNGLILFNTKNKPEQNRHAEGGLVFGIIRSVWAGVSEEILFRWLIFMGAFAAIACCNFLFFGGWLHFGVAEFLQVHLTGPVADFCSTGYMHQYLNNTENWMLGAAIISANIKFRDGHKYQGLLGLINSWYAGLFLFYIMFNFGVPAAILVHAVYDILCYTVAYLDCIIERAQGNA